MNSILLHPNTWPESTEMAVRELSVQTGRDVYILSIKVERTDVTFFLSWGQVRQLSSLLASFVEERGGEKVHE